MFCYPVQYESFEQLVGVAEQGDRSKALRNGWVLSGFSSATTLACRQSFGIVLVSVQLLKKRSSQSRALGPNCLISSVWMSSRPGALPFFSRAYSDADVEFLCSKCLVIGEHCND